MRLFAFLLIAMLLGCTSIPVFHDTLEAELQALSESLTNSKIEDLFRQNPALTLAKSTDIGNGNIRHEFIYTTVEREDVSKRPTLASSPAFARERQVTCYINIFVNNSGIIYEVLEPVIERGKFK